MGWLSNPFETTRKIHVVPIPQALPHSRKGHAERVFEKFARVVLIVGGIVMLISFIVSNLR